MAESRVCSQCGSALRTDDRFCGNCGHSVEPLPEQPSDSVVEPAVAPPPPPPPPPAASSAPAKKKPAARPRRSSSTRAKKAQKKQGGIGGRILLFVVGILVLLSAVRGPVLSVVGLRTVGTIERVTPPDEDDVYTIHYSFTAEGKERGGLYTMRTLNTSRLPGQGSSIPLRYLPGAPFINTPESYATFGIGTLLILGLGGVLIYISVKPR